MIEVVDLVKHYRAGDGSVVRAVDGISLEVAAGETVGLLGANGAGKTTTLRVLATLLAPTAGTARVAGCDVRENPIGARRRLGYVSATTGVADRLTAREIMQSYGRLHGLAETENAASGIRRDAADGAFLAPFLAAARAALGAAFEPAVQAGRSADFDTAWAGLLPWLDALPAGAPA